jgi:YD repeat-containing protein
MGVDTGYGFGWQLMLGSLMPVYSAAADPVPVQYYLFTDSTGAQYHLNQNSGSVWSSSESVYVWYDASANLLHFRNGTFWVMGCASAGGEPDAGTLYPTVVEDSNGNQIVVTYMAGAGPSWINSSARITIIEDARAVWYLTGGDELYESYTFNYVTGGNGLSYLSGITSYVGTPENYTFTINQGQPLYSPTGVSYGTTSLLAAVTTNGLGYAYDLTYDTSLNDGELDQAQFPQGGHLRWSYANLASGPQTVRYAASRYLLSALGGAESTYTLSPNAGTMTLDDASGSEKYWVFNPSGGANAGLVSELQERPYHGATQAVRHDYYTWAQDPSSLNLYLGTLKTVLDEGQAYTETTQTVQTQDSYGNVLTAQVYDYGNLNTPARAYSNTYQYQNNSNYSSRYIYNRLLTSTLTSATPNVTLVSNTYDGGTPGSPGGIPREWDAASYGTSFNYRGNVTQSNAPGKTTNTAYDATGTVVEQDDNNGHSVSVTTSELTNFTLPDSLTPNGTTSLQTLAAYSSPNLFPASVAGPGQTLYDPNNSPNGTAAYTSYDTYGRIAYTLAPSQSWTSATGAQTNYSYGYNTSTGWTTTATTANAGSTSHWTASTLDGLGRTTRVQTGNGSTTVSTDAKQNK